MSTYVSWIMIAVFNSYGPHAAQPLKVEDIASWDNCNSLATTVRAMGDVYSVKCIRIRKVKVHQ